MVDPVKHFSHAAEKLRTQIAEARHKLINVNTFADRAKQEADRAKDALAEVDTALMQMNEAAEAFKLYKGITDSDAKVLMKGIAALMEEAAERGIFDSIEEFPGAMVEEVPPTGELGIVIESPPWKVWRDFITTEHIANCNHCGGSFDAHRRGWWDDEHYAYCSIDCIAEERGSFYYPSYPGFARAPITGGFPEVPAVLTFVGTHCACNSDQIQTRGEFLPGGTEGWLSYAVAMGLYLPSWRRKVAPTHLWDCLKCKNKFNLYEGGWKDSDDDYYCSTRCAMRMAEAAEGPTFTLHPPNLGDLDIRSDFFSLEVDEEAYEWDSWIHYAEAVGWEYPEGEWK